MFIHFQEGKDTQERRSMRDKRDKRERNDNRPFFWEKLLKNPPSIYKHVGKFKTLMEIRSKSSPPSMHSITTSSFLTVYVKKPFVFDQSNTICSTTTSILNKHTCSCCVMCTLSSGRLPKGTQPGGANFCK